MNIDSNVKVGGLLFAVGLIVLGLSTIASFTLPNVIIGLWAIITGLLLLINR